jgi:hypothetical protein
VSRMARSRCARERAVFFRCRRAIALEVSERFASRPKSDRLGPISGGR